MLHQTLDSRFLFCAMLYAQMVDLPQPRVLDGCPRHPSPVTSLIFPILCPLHGNNTLRVRGQVCLHLTQRPYFRFGFVGSVWFGLRNKHFSQITTLAASCGKSWNILLLHNLFIITMIEWFLHDRYIKEGSTVSVMGVIRRHDNVLMIVPPAEPVSTGCRWGCGLLPTYVEGLVLTCDESQNADVIPV